MADEERPTVEQNTSPPSDESSCVLAEYLELFDCLGYRYKYYMAPNAQLDWFGTFHVRTPLRIHQFLVEKFGGKFRHANFSKAATSGPIESTASHMETRQLPTYEANLIHPKNIVPECTSLKTRAESDIDDEDVEMTTAPPVETARSSNRVENTDVTYTSDESEEPDTRKTKRMKYDAAPTAPFTYLRRLPTKKLQTTAASSDEDSSDDETEVRNTNLRQQIETSEYSQLRYIEALGSIFKGKSRQLSGGVAERPVRLRIGYRKNLTNQTTQFALIIYERRDQKIRQTRTVHKLVFNECDEDEQPAAIETDCIDAQPAMIRSNEGGEVRQTVATVETPTSAEIATALEEAAFTIQPPIQRTPTKATPITPSTPKRRPRSSKLNMSGIAPLTSTKKSNKTAHTTPKLSAARSLRL